MREESGLDEDRGHVRSQKHVKERLLDAAVSSRSRNDFGGIRRGELHELMLKVTCQALAFAQIGVEPEVFQNQGDVQSFRGIGLRLRAASEDRVFEVSQAFGGFVGGAVQKVGLNAKGVL